MGADYVQIMTISEPHGTGGGCYVNRYEINGNAYKQTKPLPSPMPIVNQSEAVDPVARLKELRSLLDSGTITQAEFEQLKARLIKQQ